jgi:hypothetical protein
MRVAHGAAAMRDLPLLHATGDLLLCGLLADDAASRMPFCCVRAWQLAGQGAAGRPPRGRAHAPPGGSVLRVSSRSPTKQPHTGSAQQAEEAETSSSSSGGGGGGGGCGGPAQQRPSSVMLVVGDEDRQPMLRLLEDTQHRLSCLTTTPTHLVYATDLGCVFVHPLLP